MVLKSTILSLVIYISLSDAREYVLSQYTYTWNQAKQYCDNNHGGLATILTASDVQNAKNVAGNTRSWIGLKRNEVSGWLWDDGTSCLVTTGHDCSDFWNNEEPSGDGDCVVFLETNQKFNDYICGNYQGALCNKKTSSPTTNFPTTNTPTIAPSIQPANSPTVNPTFDPTQYPTTNTPSLNPTLHPTKHSNDPTNYPTMHPTCNPIISPTEKPSNILTIQPTKSPILDGAVVDIVTTDNGIVPNIEKVGSNNSHLIWVYMLVPLLFLLITVIMCVYIKRKQNNKENKMGVAIEMNKNDNMLKEPLIGNIVKQKHDDGDIVVHINKTRQNNVNMEVVNEINKTNIGNNGMKIESDDFIDLIDDNITEPMKQTITIGYNNKNVNNNDLIGDDNIIHNDIVTVEGE
eukprot:484402_1